MLYNVTLVSAVQQSGAAASVPVPSLLDLSPTTPHPTSPGQRGALSELRVLNSSFPLALCLHMAVYLFYTWQCVYFTHVAVYSTRYHYNGREKRGLLMRAEEESEKDG